jgi:spore maturation protein CgeB
VRESRIRLLVLYAQYTNLLSYNDDWLDAFTSHPEFETKAVDIVSADGAALRSAAENVDAIVLLHSTNGDTTSYLEPFASILAERRVPLLSFVGNELNLPGSPISAKRYVLGKIRPDWVATQMLEHAGRFLFGDLVNKSVISIPHALNPDVFRPTRRLDDRATDIGVRAARYLPHLGDDDRNRLIDAFARLGAAGRLKIDISDRRFNRAGWSSFLNSCRGTVATEAGSWFLERDDARVNAIRDYVRKNSRGGLLIANDSPLRKFGHRLPSWTRVALRRFLRSGPIRHEALVNELISFDDIYQRFFAGRERAPVYGKCISSRHFDAIGTKTCQIMFYGRFNDILEPNRHYLVLQSDFSDLDDVLRRFSDLSIRRNIVEEAYAHVLSSHTYAHRMRQVAKTLASTNALSA